MRKLLRYSLPALIAGNVLIAQSHGGGGHNGGVAHASGPIGHASFEGNRRAGLVGYNPSFHTGVPPQPTRVNRIIGNHDFRGRTPYRYGYGYVLPYYPYFGYDNFWSDSSGYGPGADTSAEQTGEVTANLLGEQIQRLSAQVESLQGAPQPYPQAPYPQGSYPQQPYPMQSAHSADDPPAPKPIVLVLHSGQTLQIQNYAIMNGVLWDFTRPNSKRIPLSTIDTRASEQATEEGGGSFPEGSFATSPN